MHFQQMLRETKTKSKKFRIRWSKVPRVLEPLNRVMAIVVTRLATAKPKNTQNGNKARFPGATCIKHFQQMLRETKTKSKKFRIRWSKVPRVLEPLNRVMVILVTRLSAAVSSRKTPKMPINRNFPGLLHPMVKSTARFGAPKSSYGHFSHPAGHGRFKPKNTQNANKSQFPGATCIFSKCCERQKRRARNSASDGQKYRAFWSS